MSYRDRRPAREPERKSININASFLASLIVVLVAVFGILGINGRVDALGAKVAEVEREVERLAEVEDQVQMLELRASAIHQEVEDIAKARDQIIRAVCRVIGQSRCGLAA